MKETVYVETSIPSFYHEARTEPDMIARRQWTREWWEIAGERYALMTSPAVVNAKLRSVTMSATVKLSCYPGLAYALPFVPAR